MALRKLVYTLLAIFSGIKLNTAESILVFYIYLYEHTQPSGAKAGCLLIIDRNYCLKLCTLLITYSSHTSILNLHKYSLRSSQRVQNFVSLEIKS